jgi:hypothetical protein
MFSSEDVVVLVWAAGLDGNFKILFNHGNFFTFAAFAFVLWLHGLTLTLTISALALTLTVHPWTQLHQFCHHS